MISVETDLAQAGASACAIQHHYDVSNDFYALWLDETTRSYSCALWQDGDSLESAQMRKIDYHATNTGAGPGKVFLDVGCGWGGHLLRLAHHYHVERAVGLTLSQAQVDYVAGLGVPNIEVMLRGWQDYEPCVSFDGIISVGAFEHFAKPELSDDEMVQVYRAFFRKCHQWLKPEGSLSLQTMAYGRAGRADINQFILEEIFPESDLPNLTQIVRAAEGLFEVVAMRNDRHHYARTYCEWQARLGARRADAIRIVGEEEFKRFRTYQGMFAVAFHTGAMDLYRLHLRRVRA